MIRPQILIKQVFFSRYLWILAAVTVAGFVFHDPEFLQFLLFPVVLVCCGAVLLKIVGRSAYVIMGTLLAFWLLSAMPREEAVTISKSISKPTAYRLQALLDELAGVQSFPYFSIEKWNTPPATLLHVGGNSEWLDIRPRAADMVKVDDLEMFMGTGAFQQSVEPEEITKHFLAAYSRGLELLENNSYSRSQLFFQRAATFPGYWKSGVPKGAAWFMASVAEVSKSHPDYQKAFDYLAKASSTFSQAENNELYGRIMNNAAVVKLLASGDYESAIQLCLKGLNSFDNPSIDSNLHKLVSRYARAQS